MKFFGRLLSEEKRHKPNGRFGARLVGPYFLCGILIVTSGCGSNRATQMPKTVSAKVPDTKSLATLRSALNILEDVPGESFRSFLPRARAALLSSRNAQLRATARRLPDVPALYIGGLQKHFLPLLLARWAKGRSRVRRAQAQRTLLQGDTEWRLGTDQNAPRLMRQEIYLKNLSAEHGLRFQNIDDVVYEMGALPPEGGISPKMSISVALFARGDVAQPFELVPQKHAPGTIVDEKIYGPSASSDRAALTAAFFAIEAFLNSGVPAVRYPSLVVDRYGNLDGRGTRHFLSKRGIPYRTLSLDGALPFSSSSAGFVSVSSTREDENSVHPANTARLVYANANPPKEHVPTVAQATFLVANAEKSIARLRKRASFLWGEKQNALFTTLAEDLVSISLTTKGGALWASSNENALQRIALLTREVLPQATPCGKLLEQAAVDVELAAIAPLEKSLFKPSGFSLDERGHCEITFGARLSAQENVLAGARQTSIMQAEFEAERRAVLREKEKEAKPKSVRKRKSARSKREKKRWKPPPIFRPVLIQPSRQWHALVEETFRKPIGAGKSSGTRLTIELAPPSVTAIHKNVQEKILRAAELAGTVGISQETARASLTRLLPNALSFGPLVTEGSAERLFNVDDTISFEELDGLIEVYTYAISALCF
ncbi:MAG: hypothetical protein GY822_31410 [Deltaproteobacteria bacterium]|nr:hypothetical protein [Deltaproteobacteria bacterium]